MNAKTLTTGKMIDRKERKTPKPTEPTSAVKNSSSFTKWLGNKINNISGQTAVMEFNAAEAEKARQHEIYKMENAYQMSTKDMEAAGLNPGLMYGSGGAAMASSASQASSSGNGAGIVSGITNVFTSAAKLINANDNTKNIEAQNKIYHSAAKTLSSVLKLMK